jgi:hypothetical protein
MAGLVPLLPGLIFVDGTAACSQHLFDRGPFKFAEFAADAML